MSGAVILGVDPGFAHLGLARVRLFPRQEVVDSMRVVTTTKGKRRGEGVRAAADNVDRLREIWAWLVGASLGVSAICSEEQSWPRNASSSIKVGMVWGLLVAAAELRDVPLLQVPPQEIKRTLTGHRKASKADVQSALEDRYPELPSWPAGREHAADALGAVVACLGDNAIRAIRVAQGG